MLIWGMEIISKNLLDTMSAAADVLNKLKHMSHLVDNFGDKAVVIGLSGDLGSGKTTLLKYWAITCINDKVLPKENGFPFKVRVPTKLGFKNPKHVTEIFVTNDYPGGYWEDKGYNWFSGS